MQSCTCRTPPALAARPLPPTTRYAHVRPGRPTGGSDTPNSNRRYPHRASHAPCGNPLPPLRTPSGRPTTPTAPLCPAGATLPTARSPSGSLAPPWHASAQLPRSPLPVSPGHAHSAADAFVARATPHVAELPPRRSGPAVHSPSRSASSRASLILRAVLLAPLLCSLWSAFDCRL